MILSAEQRRVLEYVHAANTGGYRPTYAQVDEWRRSPDPKPGKQGRVIRPATAGTLQRTMAEALAPGIGAIARSIMAMSSLEGVMGTPEVREADGPPETLIQSLVRLDWLSESPGSAFTAPADGERRLAATDLGRALLRAEQRQDSGSGDVVLLSKDDPLAYAALMSRVADLDGNPLIVDPYLRAEQLLSFLQVTAASRFLIGSRVSKGEVAAMQTLLQSQGWAVPREQTSR